MKKLIFIILFILSSQSFAATMYQCGTQKITAHLSNYYIDGRINSKLIKKEAPKNKNSGLFITFDYGGLAQSSVELNVNEEVLQKFNTFAVDGVFEGVITAKINDGGITPQIVEVIDIELPQLNKQLQPVQVNQMINKQECQ